MVAAITSEGLNVLIRGLKDTLLAKYLAGAAFTLLIYDWLLVSPVESQTIWTSRWTSAKILYYFIRIFSFPFLAIAAYELIDFRPALSSDFCNYIFPLFTTIPMFMTFAASNWLFTLRLIALYQHQRVLVWFMRIFYALTYATTLSFIIASLVIYRRLGVSYNPIVKSCQALQTIPYTGPVFYTPALYELLIFTLTAYRAHKDAVLANPSKPALLIALYRDGIICFFVMLAMRTWVIWIYVTQPITSILIGTNIYWAIDTILSTRVYLNIVWLANKQSSPSTNSGVSASIGNPTMIGGAAGGYIGLRNMPRKHELMLSPTIGLEGGSGYR